MTARNEDKGACTYSPARAGAGTNNGPATMAATNQDNEETRFSTTAPAWHLGTGNRYPLDRIGPRHIEDVRHLRGRATRRRRRGALPVVAHKREPLGDRECAQERRDNAEQE
jgi:hypothetical protein